MSNDKTIIKSQRKLALRQHFMVYLGRIAVRHPHPRKKNTAQKTEDSLYELEKTQKQNCMAKQNKIIIDLKRHMPK